MSAKFGYLLLLMYKCSFKSVSHFLTISCNISLGFFEFFSCGFLKNKQNSLKKTLKLLLLKKKLTTVYTTKRKCYKS